MESLNLKIKSISDSNPSDQAKYLDKIQTKLTSVNTKLNINYKQIEEFSNAMHNLSNSISTIKAESIPSTSKNSTTSDAKEKLNTILTTLGFVNISRNLLNLSLTLVAFTEYSNLYDNIKNNPAEFKALLERLPIKSQYNNSNNYIYKGNKYDAESMIPLVASQDLLRTISTKELISFHRFITTTPLLGLHHKIGEKIFSYINGLEKKCFKRKLNMKLYHGRIRDITGKPLNILELFEAPFSIAPHGRANMIGIPALYFSDDPYTVIMESRWKEKDSILDGFETEINRNFTMLDITDITCELFSYCYFPHKSANDLSAYIIPNFIADCCRYKKIDGMIYKSVQKSDSINYVFFYPDKSWFKKTKYFYWDGGLNWL